MQGRFGLCVSIVLATVSAQATISFSAIAFSFRHCMNSLAVLFGRLVRFAQQGSGVPAPGATLRGRRLLLNMLLTMRYYRTANQYILQQRISQAAKPCGNSGLTRSIEREAQIFLLTKLAIKMILLTIQYGCIVLQYIGNAGMLRRPVIYGPPFLIRSAAASVSK